MNGEQQPTFMPEDAVNQQQRQRYFEAMNALKMILLYGLDYSMPVEYRSHVREEMLRIAAILAEAMGMDNENS